MRKLEIVEMANLPRKQDIESFGEQNSIILSQSYVNFLLEYNPIEIKEDYFELNNRSYVLNSFFPFDEKDELSLQSRFKEYNDFLMDKYLAFAYDPGGWLFVISIQEIDHGKIYFCRTDEELEDSLTLLANNFEQFIDLLQEKPQS